MTTKGNRHAAMAAEYAHKMLTEKEPWRKLQVKLEDGWALMDGPPSWVEDVDYRWEPPRTITLAGVEFPEPLREEPAYETTYWMVQFPHAVRATGWTGEMCEFDWLRKGLLQATKEGAKAQLKAMILSVGGDPE